MKSRYISFSLGGQDFEYDEAKNRENIRKHGISFKSAARVFFDYDRIELYDKKHSQDEERYDTIGNASVDLSGTVIGNTGYFYDRRDDILFVVYTERIHRTSGGNDAEIIRLISARFATEFERGLYYGKQ